MMKMNKKGVIGNLIACFVVVLVFFMLWSAFDDLQESCNIENSSENCEPFNDDTFVMFMNNKTLIFTAMALPFVFIFGGQLISFFRGILLGVEEFIEDFKKEKDEDDDEDEEDEDDEEDEEEEYLKESKPELKVKRTNDFEPVKKTVEGSGVDFGKGMDSYEGMKGDDKK